MDTGTMFLLGIICVATAATWILGRQHNRGLEAQAQQRLDRDLERERVRLAALEADRAAHERQVIGDREGVRESRIIQ